MIKIENQLHRNLINDIVGVYKYDTGTLKVGMLIEYEDGRVEMYESVPRRSFSDRNKKFEGDKKFMQMTINQNHKI